MWLNFLAVFNFFQKYRLRQDLLRREAREDARERHQESLEQYTTIVRELATLVEKQLKPVTELIAIQEKQVDLLSNWFKSFQAPAIPTSTQVPDLDDVWVPALPGGRAALGLDDLPEEFKLAFALNQDDGTFDREGRDEM